MTEKMLSHHRILVVDDEEKIRKSLGGLLEDNGYEVGTAGSVSECLQILSSQNIDLVIIDIVMPEMSGIEALQEIREKFKDTEVIIISGYADKEKAIAAFRLGAYDLIEKPFEAREILNTIANCLNQLQLRRNVEKMTKELASERERLLVTLRSIGDGVIATDIGGKIVLVNKVAEELTGWTQEEAIERPYSEIFHIINEKTREEPEDPIAKVIKNGLIVGLANHTVLVARDGTERIIADSGAPIKDEDGNIIGVVLVFRDITEHKLAEEALIERKRQQKAILNNIPDIAWLKDKESRFIAANDPFGRACGVSPEDLVGKTDFDIWPKDLAERYRADDREVMKSGRRKQVEEPLVDKDGKKTWLETIKTPIYNDKGEIIGTTGIARDITERKRAEEELRESEEKFRTISNTAVDAILLMDSEGRISYWNRAAERMFGYPSAEALGKELHLFLAPIRYHGAYMKGFSKFKGTGQGPAVGTTSEFLAIKKDGTEFPIEVSTSAIQIKGQWNAVGIIRDLTERKKAEEALIERDRQQKAILNNIPDIAWLKDKESRYIAVNEPFGSACGVKPEDLVGKTDLDIWPSKLAERYRTDDREVMKTGRRKQVEEPLVDKEGKRMWVETIKTPIYNDIGEIIGTTGIARDITERKLAEEELRRVAIENAGLFESVKQQGEQLRALTMRLAESEEAERRRLARELHDTVGQNLTAIAINLNIVQAQMRKETSSQILSRLDDSFALIEQTTERIRNVMADLKPPVLDDYGLAAALRWYGTQFCSRTGIYVEVKGEETFPRLSPHVENAMFRISQEALTNVAKYAQASQVTIIAEAGEETVRLVITDNGVGFDPIQDNPDKTQSWGLLTMSERAAAIGGHFRIDSRIGEGTSVVVEVAR